VIPFSTNWKYHSLWIRDPPKSFIQQNEFQQPVKFCEFLFLIETIPESMEANQTYERRPEMLYFANNHICEAKNGIIQKKSHYILGNHQISRQSSSLNS
jgi:hypothetical protein